ncbi:unnamed protein product, partial [Rotaria sp. Silwood1]
FYENILSNVIRQFFSRGHRYMYVGIDLSHGAPGSARKFSTVAVVASADDIPNRYFKEIYMHSQCRQCWVSAEQKQIQMHQLEGFQFTNFNSMP